MAGFDMGAEGSGIVATHLEDTGAERSGTVIFAGNDIGVGLETALEIGTYRGDENEEEVFVGRFNTNGNTGADEQRTEVEAGACAIRRNETLVELDDLLAHLDEFLSGEFGHHDATAGALQALGIGFGTEHTDFVILAAVSFQTFKSLLTIVETGGSHVYGEILFGRDFNFAPLTIAIPATDVIIGFQVTKREVLPINIHSTNYI